MFFRHAPMHDVYRYEKCRHACHPCIPPTVPRICRGRTIPRRCPDRASAPCLMAALAALGLPPLSSPAHGHLVPRPLIITRVVPHPNPPPYPLGMPVGRGGTNIHALGSAKAPQLATSEPTRAGTYRAGTYFLLMIYFVLICLSTVDHSV